MPRRTITVTHLRMHARYRSEDLWRLDRLPDGADLLHLAHGLFRLLPKDDLVDRERERYVSLERQRPEGRTLLLELRAGAFGAAGETRDVNTHAVEHQFGVTGTATTAVRALLVVPTNSYSALFFVEHGGTGGGGQMLLTQLKNFLRHRYRNATAILEAVVEPEAWLESAELNRTTAVVYGFSPNLEDRIQGLPEVLGRAEHTIRPERGQRILPRAIYETLRDRKINRAALFGLRTPEENIRQVTVTMSNNGRQKTFSLGDERFPTLRYLFTEAGDLEPTGLQFREYCLEQVEDLFSAVGADWQDAYRSGGWPRSALEMAVEVPPV